MDCKTLIGMKEEYKEELRHTSNDARKKELRKQIKIVKKHMKASGC